MSKRTWKMEYWPEITAMMIEDNKKSGNNNIPAMYDYGSGIRNHMKKYGIGDSSNKVGYRQGSYYYINTPEKMKQFVDNWETLIALSTYVSRINQYMKPYEKKYLHQIIYNKRKEEFDALVSKNDS